MSNNEEKAFEQFCKDYYSADKGYSDWLANGGCGDDKEEKALYQMRDIINLVHRLQDENAKQKAEIERLTKRLDDRCDRCIERERKDTAKYILEKVYSYTVDDEIGMRYLIKNLGKDYGVEVE